jgi:hypothetical protein
MVLILAVLATGCLPVAPTGSSLQATGTLLQAPPAPGRTLGSGLNAVPGPIPFPFEQNVGQAGESVAFLLRAGAFQTAFGTGGVTYRLVGEDPADEPVADPDCALRRDRHQSIPAPSGASPTCRPMRSYLVNVELVGATASTPVGTVPADTAVTYLVGPTEDHHHDVPVFHQVSYQDAWPSIDVVYERSERGLKSTYLLAPDSDPEQIQVAWNGVNDGHVAEDGALVLRTPLGELRESAPVAWQDGPNGVRKPVTVSWAPVSQSADGASRWTFALGEYDAQLPLVIDPVISYGSYLGNDRTERADGIAVDGASAAYVSGRAGSSLIDFMSAPGFDQTFGGDINDNFVVKIAPHGQRLVYATFLGGNGGEADTDIAVDSSGAAVVVGSTGSTDFGFGGAPGFDQTIGGGGDLYLVKLAPDGRSLVFGTFLGGSSTDGGWELELDAVGAIYVMGASSSPDVNFGGAPGFDQSPSSPLPGFGINDILVAKFSPDGMAVIWGLILTQSKVEWARGLAIDPSGGAYVLGVLLNSQGDPTYNLGCGSAPGLATTPHHVSEILVIKIAPDGRSPQYCTFLGGDGDEDAFGITVDATGAAYVAGRTDSSDFPTSRSTPAAQQTFILKLAPNGQAISSVTYFGGSLGDIPMQIALDPSGALYVAGYTTSADFDFRGAPGPDQSFNGDDDGFLFKTTPNGQGFAFGTYIGGVGSDRLYDLAVDGSGAAYVIGDTTGSMDFQGAPGFDQTAAINYGTTDALIVKIGDAVEPTITPTLAGATPTATLPPTVSCVPRPRVAVAVQKAGDGRLLATVSASGANNTLSSLRFTSTPGAQVDFASQNGRSGAFEVPLAAGTVSTQFWVRRVSSGAATAHLVIVDRCGDWPTFVGGGASAW